MKRVIIIASMIVASGCFDVLYGPAYDIERERITRENHAFPVDSAAHAGMDCNYCHGEFDTFTQFTCISCKDHEQAKMDPAHQGIVDYTYSATSCYDCHPTGERMTREQHQPFFPIVSGRHADIQCTECHPGGYGTFSCITCHEHLCTEMNDKHSDVANYACENTRCLECHPQGEKDED